MLSALNILMYIVFYVGIAALLVSASVAVILIALEVADWPRHGDLTKREKENRRREAEIAKLSKDVDMIKRFLEKRRLREQKEAEAAEQGSFFEDGYFCGFDKGGNLRNRGRIPTEADFEYRRKFQEMDDTITMTVFDESQI